MAAVDIKCGDMDKYHRSWAQQNWRHFIKVEALSGQLVGEEKGDGVPHEMGTGVPISPGKWGQRTVFKGVPISPCYWQCAQRL